MIKFAAWFRPQSRSRLITIILISMVAGALTQSLATNRFQIFSPQIKKNRRVKTTLVDYEYEVHNFKDRLEGAGGGLAIHHNDVLIARSQKGLLHRFDVETRQISALQIGLPENHFEELKGKVRSGLPFPMEYLRYNDLEFLENDSGLQLVVSYLFFNHHKSCLANRVAVRTLNADWRQTLPDSGKYNRDGWRVVWESAPCLSLEKKLHGNQAGGRIAYDGQHTLYLTVGDFGFDGVVNRELQFSQDSKTAYGKTLTFDTRTWSHSLFSIGHRNAQGITLDDRGQVWSVEHGPHGGDELNRLQRGGNYGWPFATLGVNYPPWRWNTSLSPYQYPATSWPLTTKAGHHEGYLSPVYAWLPSIGISNIKVIRDLDPRVNGDLLISSLKDGSLFRVRVVDGRVLYAEPTKIGPGVRYVEVAHGEIYLLLDPGYFATMRPIPLESKGVEGQLATCMNCHSESKSPSLNGVLGRPIASEFNVEYSASLKQLGGVWTIPRLREFLTDPQKFAPGTSMPPPQMSPVEIEALVKALSEARSL